MNSKFSAEVKKIIQLSREEAVRLGHDYIGTEHLLLGILQEKELLAVKVLDFMDVDFSELILKIEDNINHKSQGDTRINIGNIPLNKQAEKVLKLTFLEAKVLKNTEISPEHLMLSILKHKENLASKILYQFEVDYESYKSELEYVSQEEKFSSSEFYSSAADPDLPMEEEGQTPKYSKKGNTKSKNTGT